MKLLLTPDGRRGAALILMALGGATMTAYASVALYFVRKSVSAVLTLGLAAHVSIFVVLTGFAGLLVKRMLKASVAGNTFEAQDSVDASQSAAIVAGAAQGAADAIQGAGQP